MDSGQLGIRFREALVEGDGRAAAAIVPALDDAHRIELVLGAALRDGRGDFQSARLYLDAERTGAWGEVCARLAEPGVDPSLDEEVAAWVAAGLVPERFLAEGPAPPPVGGDVWAWTVEALHVGCGGGAILAALPADDPLHAAVTLYYRRGRIHALGLRPLLLLARRAARRAQVSPPSTTKV